LTFLNPTVRRVLKAIAALLLLGLAWNGITGGFDQISESHTPGEIAQTAFQFAFGLFALLSVVAAYWIPRWTRLMLAGFTISATLAAALASIFWGNTSLLIGVASGAGGFAIAACIAWLLSFRVETHSKDHNHD
jgi:hypothetical protein